MVLQGPLMSGYKLYGADIIRLWICSQDYRGDVPVSDNIVKNVANNYRNIRNTLRYQIGSLYDFEPSKDALALHELHPVDKWALNELGKLVTEVTLAYDAYEYHRAFKEFIDPFLLEYPIGDIPRHSQGSFVYLRTKRST